jgi:hypothetical protein
MFPASWVSLIRKQRKRLGGVAKTRGAALMQAHFFGFFELASLLLIAAALAIVATAGVFVGDGKAHGAAEIVTLAGMFVGCTLLLEASRHYLLGIGGLIVTVFVTILLTTYAGLVMNMASTRRATPSLPRQVPLTVDRPALFLAAAGFVAAILLLPSPWSPGRKLIQPILVAGATLLPAIAVALMSDGRSSSGDVVYRFVGQNDPLLALGIIGLVLVAPVQLSGAVGWVCFWVAGASRLKRWLGRPLVQFLGLTAWSGWLLAGVASLLPRSIGGELSVWSTMRSAPWVAWSVAAAAVAAIAYFVQRAAAHLDQAEGLAVIGVTVVWVLGEFGAAVGAAVLLVISYLVVNSETAGVGVALVLIAVAVVVVVVMLWFGRRPFINTVGMSIAAAVALILLVFAAHAWPAAHDSTVATPRIHLGSSAFGQALNSRELALAVLVCFPLVGLITAGAYAFLMRRVFGRDVPWKGSAEYGYALALLPLGSWFLVGAALLIVPTADNPLTAVPTRWELPDPSVVALVGSVALTARSIVKLATRRPQPLNPRIAGGIFALSALAFVPSFVPDAFRAGGRLALVGLVLQLIFLTVVLGSGNLPPDQRDRNVRWTLGASALSIPLLAYAALSSSAAHLPRQVSGVIADVGQHTNYGPFSNLRRLLILPLLVSLIVADRPVPRVGWTPRRQSRWRDFEADVIAQSVVDGDLPEILADSVRGHLDGLESDERKSYALQLARLLFARYRNSQSPATQTRSAPRPDRQDIDEALARAMQGLTGRLAPGDVRFVHAVASRINEPATQERGTSSGHHRHLAAALLCAVDDHVDAVPTLVEATLDEVTASAKAFVTLKKDGRATLDQAELERATLLYRQRIGRVLAALPHTFTLFHDPGVLAITPALILDDPPRERWGLNRPYRHPYAYVSLALCIFAGVVVGCYFSVGPLIDLGSRLAH